MEKCASSKEAILSCYPYHWIKESCHMSLKGVGLLWFWRDRVSPNLLSFPSIDPSHLLFLVLYFIDFFTVNWCLCLWALCVARDEVQRVVLLLVKDLFGLLGISQRRLVLTGLRGWRVGFEVLLSPSPAANVQPNRLQGRGGRRHGITNCHQRLLRASGGDAPSRCGFNATQFVKVLKKVSCSIFQIYHLNICFQQPQDFIILIILVFWTSNVAYV